MDLLDAVAATFSGQPDLPGSDVMMPGLSGIELAAQIQQVCPMCQVLLISGVVGTTASDAGGKHGHRFDLLAKTLGTGSC
jgi:CheY-like chemotaxis protein